MASRRNGDRHDAHYPGSGDGRSDDTAVKGGRRAEHVSLQASTRRKP